MNIWKSRYSNGTRCSSDRKARNRNSSAMGRWIWTVMCSTKRKNCQIFLPLSLPRIPSQKNRRKPESIGEEMNCVVILKRKRSCIRSPKIRENVRSAAVSSCRFQKNTSPHGSALSLRRSLRSHTFVRSTNVNTAISTEIRRIL